MSFFFKLQIASTMSALALDLKKNAGSDYFQITALYAEAYQGFSDALHSISAQDGYAKRCTATFFRQKRSKEKIACLLIKIVCTHSTFRILARLDHTGNIESKTTVVLTNFHLPTSDEFGDGVDCFRNVAHISSDVMYGLRDEPYSDRSGKSILVTSDWPLLKEHDKITAPEQAESRSDLAEDSSDLGSDEDIEPHDEKSNVSLFQNNKHRRFMARLQHVLKNKAPEDRVHLLMDSIYNAPSWLSQIFQTPNLVIYSNFEAFNMDAHKTAYPILFQTSPIAEMCRMLNEGYANQFSLGDKGCMLILVADDFPESTELFQIH